MLAVGSKPGGPFKRVGKGTYTLADPTAHRNRPARVGGHRREACIGQTASPGAPDEDKREHGQQLTRPRRPSRRHQPRESRDGNERLSRS